MSHLKLFRPAEGSRVFRFDQPEPETIPFKPHFQRRLRSQPRQPQSLISRARLLHDNRNCPHCEHPSVEPLELDDAVYNCSGLPIPGTATLVGFHCLNCHTEWPAES
jgi:hypothetical protein